MTDSLTIIAPDDWHCHLRDGVSLETTVGVAAKQFNRVVVMPNLVYPVSTATEAESYRNRILSFADENPDFEPMMTLYLTDETSPKHITDAKASNIVIGCKLYPANVTTLSQHGVKDIKALYPTFEAMQKTGLPLLVHGEVNDPHIDIFDREAIFIDTHLTDITKRFPDLKIVLEHITTKRAVEFIQACSSHVGATITPHHLLANRNHLLVGGIKPHYYCLPILKRRSDQEALVQAAISGSPHFFIGTDSAPHAKSKKESACGCAGIFHTNALLLYAQVFEDNKALDKLEAFTSRYGAEFYGLPLNKTKITLQKGETKVPPMLPLGDEIVLPFLAGETLMWEQVN